MPTESSLFPASSGVGDKKLARCKEHRYTVDPDGEARRLGVRERPGLS